MEARQVLPGVVEKTHNKIIAWQQGGKTPSTLSIVMSIAGTLHYHVANRAGIAADYVDMAVLLAKEVLETEIPLESGGTMKIGPLVGLSPRRQLARYRCQRFSDEESTREGGIMASEMLTACTYKETGYRPNRAKFPSWPHWPFRDGSMLTTPVKDACMAAMVCNAYRRKPITAGEFARNELPEDLISMLPGPAEPRVAARRTCLEPGLSHDHADSRA